MGGRASLGLEFFQNVCDTEASLEQRVGTACFLVDDGKESGFGFRAAWVWVPSVAPDHLVALGQSLNLSEPQFCYLQNAVPVRIK